MWWSVYRVTDGSLVAHGSELPVLPSGQAAVEHAERQDQGGVLWNSATLAWDLPRPVDPPLVDRLSDLAAHPYLAEVWSRLTAPQRIKLRKLFVWLLGSHRRRSVLEDVAVDPPDGWPTDPSLAVE